MKYLIFVPIFMIWALLTVLVLNPPDNTEEVVVEQPPKLYCQYGAGYGKAVFGYEKLTSNQILTDENEVFDLRICDEWRQDEDNTK